MKEKKTRISVYNFVIFNFSVYHLPQLFHQTFSQGVRALIMLLNPFIRAAHALHNYLQGDINAVVVKDCLFLNKRKKIDKK